MGTAKIILDLNSGKRGKNGQIIQIWAGQDIENENVVIAESFEIFSDEILQRLKLGKYEFEDDIIEFEDDWII